MGYIIDKRATHELHGHCLSLGFLADSFCLKPCNSLLTQPPCQPNLRFSAISRQLRKDTRHLFCHTCDRSDIQLLQDHPVSQVTLKTDSKSNQKIQNIHPDGNIPIHISLANLFQHGFNFYVQLAWYGVK